MRNLLIIQFFILLLLPFISFTQTNHSLFLLKKADKNLYMLYYDSLATRKSTVVEFNDFLAMIDMPFANGGGSTPDIVDHIEAGEKVIYTLKHHFPKKPLRYVFSSHWHQHSISAVKPFITKNIKLVTTQYNFAKLRELIDSTTYKKYQQNIYIVEGDSMKIEDKRNTIIAYKLKEADYPTIPTKDFLFFYLPKYQTICTSCMYMRDEKTKVLGKELINNRLFDVQKFIQAQKFPIDHIATYNTFYDEANGLISKSSLEKVLETGITL